MKFSRREALIGVAAAALTPPDVAEALTGSKRALALAPQPFVWRAGATNTDATNLRPASDSNCCGALYTGHYRKQAFSQIQVMIPLYTMSSATPNYEQDLPEPYNFGIALVYPFSNTPASVPSNTQYRFKFSGQTVFNYTLRGQLQPFAVSDVLTLPFTIPANTKFGCITVSEPVTVGASKGLNRAAVGSNALGRNEGYIRQATSILGGAFPTSFTTYTTVPSGGANSNPMGPGAFLTPHSLFEPSIGINGNSEEFGTLEGAGLADVTGNYGDSGGDIYGNRGYPARLGQNLGVDVTMHSRGADCDNYHLITPTYTATIASGVLTITAFASTTANGITSGAAWPGQFVYGNSIPAGTYISSQLTGTAGSTGTYQLQVAGVNSSYTNASSLVYTGDGNMSRRLAFWAACGLTHFHDLCPTNEFTKTNAVPPWNASTTYAKYAAIEDSSGARLYVTLNGGTSGSTNPTGTTTFNDNGIVWTYVGVANLYGIQSRYFGNWVGNKSAKLALVQAALPNVLIIGSTGAPQVTSNLAVTSFAYNSTSGVMTLNMTAALAGLGLSTSSPIALSGFTGGSSATFNTAALSISVFPLTIDTVGNIITVQFAASLTAPTGGTAVVNAYAISTATQVASTATSLTPGNSFKTQQQSFVRSQPNPILPFACISDWDAANEAFSPALNPTYSNGGVPTPSQETGLWLPAANNLGATRTVDLNHSTSYGYQDAANQMAANSNIAAIWRRVAI